MSGQAKEEAREQAEWVNAMRDVLGALDALALLWEGEQEDWVPVRFDCGVRSPLIDTRARPPGAVSSR